MKKLPDGLTIYVEHGVVMATDPETGSSFVIREPLSVATICEQIEAHRDKWRLDQLMFAPVLEQLREAGFLPGKSIVDQLSSK